MPRRNRNANPTPAISADALADEMARLPRDLAAPRCAACRVNPATTGAYCALCKGAITVSARRTTLTRR